MLNKSCAFTGHRPYNINQSPKGGYATLTADLWRMFLPLCHELGEAQVCCGEPQNGKSLAFAGGLY